MHDAARRFSFGSTWFSSLDYAFFQLDPPPADRNAPLPIEMPP